MLLCIVGCLYYCLIGEEMWKLHGGGTSTVLCAHDGTSYAGVLVFMGSVALGRCMASYGLHNSTKIVCARC